MQLITIGLLSALLGRKRRVGHGGLPSFVGVMETTHVLPGRLRLRAPVLIGQRAAADQLQKSLARLDGVHVVEVSSVSGSLLIRFAPDRVKPDMLMAAAIRLLGLERDIEKRPPSHIGAGIRQAAEALNHGIREESSGMIDLWTSLTLLLVAAGIRQLAAGNQFGWALLWWAYRSLSPPDWSRR